MSKVSQLDVSRETMERLDELARLLKKWNSKINLVSGSTINDVWRRHIMDSVQIFDLVSHPIDKWVDMGSGGGFPGLVISILSQERTSPAHMTLIESDTRKCVFLRTAARELSLKVDVVNKRIEQAKPAGADVVSARALSKLPVLFEYGVRHLKPGGLMLFPKGPTWKAEIKEAQSSWKFEYDAVKSTTNEGSVVVCARGVERV